MLAARSPTSARASVICPPSRLRAGRSLGTAARPAAEPSAACPYRSGSQAAPAYAVARRNSRRFIVFPLRSVLVVLLRAAAHLLGRIAAGVQIDLLMRGRDQ